MESDDPGLQIEITNSTSRRIPVRRIRSLIGYVLRHSRPPRAARRRRVGGAGRRQPAYVELAVVGDAAMRSLNRRWLNRDRTSDVLSFDLSDDEQFCAQIVVNVEQARRQARLRGRGYGAELMLYVVHGLLHLLGYDDADPDQARRMHAREDQLLRRFGIGAVYADDLRAAGGKRAGTARPEKVHAGKKGAFDKGHSP